MSKTATENKMRVIRDEEINPGAKRQQAKTNAKMFQNLKAQKKGRRK